MQRGELLQESAGSRYCQTKVARCTRPAVSSRPRGFPALPLSRRPISHQEQRGEWKGDRLHHPGFES